MVRLFPSHVTEDVGEAWYTYERIRLIFILLNEKGCKSYEVDISGRSLEYDISKDLEQRGTIRIYLRSKEPVVSWLYV